MARLSVKQVRAKLSSIYKILIVLFILSNRNQNVKSSFVGYMSDQASELKSSVEYSIKTVLTKIISLLHYKTPDLRPRVLVMQTLSNFGDVLSSKAPTSRPVPHFTATSARPLETHVIQTEDGYILTIHRLPPSAGLVRPVVANHTVLLHHGLLGSSADWTLLKPGKSLPYILSDAGYDVWLANARGNCFSRAHVSKKINSREYWDFSWHEIGKYDLPAILHYIRNTTKTTEGINYVGHSMGATALLVLLSVEPKYNEYLRIAILLGPLAMMNHTQGPMATLAPIVADLLPSELEEYIELLGGGEYMPSHRIPTLLADKFCKGKTILCMNSLLFLSGDLLQENSTDSDFISRLLYNVPAGGSINTILHYAELITNRKFHKFGNKHAEYPLRNINVPIVIFSSSDDLLSNVLDNQKLYCTIVNPVAHIIIQDQNISHTEFVWGLNAENLVFSKVLDVLERCPVLRWNSTKLEKGLIRD